MKILIIAPHMDDEVLGCGGTIACHVAKKDDVYVCFVAHRVYGHRFNKEENDRQKKHALAAKKKLAYEDAVFFDLNDERLDGCIQDIIIPLEKYVAKVQPEIVYAPFYQDNNQDHRAVFEASRVVLRPSAASYVRKFLLYETLSSTEQSPPIANCAFLPNLYIDISDFMDKKIKAFNCYETERREFPHPRSAQAIEVLARKRGLEIGFKYAEAFIVLRERAR